MKNPWSELNIVNKSWKVYVNSPTASNPKAHVKPSRVEHAKAILTRIFPVFVCDEAIFFLLKTLIAIMSTTKLTRRIKATGRRTAK